MSDDFDFDEEDDDFDDILGVSSSSDDDLDDGLTEGDELGFATGGKNFHRTLAVTQVDSVRKGAPPNWFAKLLGIGITTVKRKIPDTIDPIHVGAKGTQYYRPADVLPFLVQPHDMKSHLMRMNPKDLPERLRKEFWGSRKLEQEVRLRAGDLYLAADVHKSYGDMMKLVKDTVLLWTDEVHEAVGLSNEQVAVLDNLSRKLLSNFADAVESYCANNITRPQDSELDEIEDA